MTHLHILGRRTSVRLHAYLGVSFFIFGLVACSGPVSQRSRLQAPAPQSKSDVGVIVEVTDEDQLIAFLEKYDARARELHRGSHLYEIFNADPSIISRQLPTKNQLVEPNQYVPRLIPDERMTTNPELRSFISSCRNDINRPQAALTTEKPDMILKGQVTVGQTLRFLSELSQPHPTVGGLLRSVWILNPPSLSRLSRRPTASSDLSFEPDVLGAYELSLVVIDSRNVCHLETRSFIVTDNPDRATIQPQSPLPTFDLLRDFSYLAQINALKSRQLPLLSPIKIAILDTGVNYNHPDLWANIAINSREIPGNGIDDDGNNLIDDEYGWDFANNDNRPFDDSGHGTHVAGLAAATTFGVFPNAQIIPVKVLNGSGGGDVASIAAGIFYAVDAGAKVINASLGSMASEFLILQKAIKYAATRNVLVVAAAGNGDPQSGVGMNIDVTAVYPAAFDETNLISVAASHGEILASYSNFGASLIDIAAPGGDYLQGGLLSTALANPYQKMYEARVGTSMAAPLVSGAAALILSRYPNLKPGQITHVLLGSGTLAPRLKGLIRSSRILNVQNSLITATSIWGPPENEPSP